METKTIQSRFGDRVRELRSTQNLSQEELAFRAGIHRNYLGGIERGERNPSLKNISAIARALGIDISELFRLQPVRHRKPKNRPPK